MKIKTYILLLIMAIVASACANDADKEAVATDVTGLSSALVPVRFSISEHHIFDMTRSVTSIDEFDADEEIRVWVKPNGAANYVAYDYTTHESGANVALDPPATPPFFPANEPSTVEAYAYYPASATTTFVVRDDQTSDEGYKASDLMFAANRTVTKEGTDGNEVLTMNHQMAQLRITASVQEGSGLNIIGVTVEAKDSVRFTPDGESVTTTIGTKGTIRALNAAGTGYILIPPQEMEGLTVKVFTGEGTDAETATYVLHRENTSDSFRAGYSYNIQLKVTANQLGTTSFVSDWNALGSVTVTPTGDLVVHPKNVEGITYNGTEHRPLVDVYKDGEKINDSKYTLQYVNNINAGLAFVIVTGDENDPDFKGCVGIATFTIAPAAGTISYASNSEEKTYLDSNFTKLLSKTGDGIVTYSSSNTEVATVNETTGEVTILKSGETTITATVADGSNYTYATKTASYTLTVAKKAASISFADFPVKTWSATAAENTFTPTLTNTGTSAVTYTLTDNTCGATISGNTVSFTQAGAVTVTATVEDNDRYTYAVKSISKTLTVNKHAGFLTLSSNSGSVQAGNSTTITVSTCHNTTTLRAQVTSGPTDRTHITGPAGPDNKQFTIETSSSDAATVTITVTCDADEHYLAATQTFTLTITSADVLLKNPLYYVAEYNVGNSAGTQFATGVNNGYFFTWTAAMSLFAASTSSYSTYSTASKGPDNHWHLPILEEWWSIVPGVDVSILGYDTNNSTSIGTLKSQYITPKWGYNATTKAGVSESSYWEKPSATEIHAIRFIGTSYCSLWKYTLSGGFTSSNYGCLTVSSVVIDGSAITESNANSWYNSNFNSTFNNADGVVQRVFGARGYRSADGGSGATATGLAGERGHFWAARDFGPNNTKARCMYFYNDFLDTHYGDTKAYGFDVRLFLDN